MRIPPFIFRTIDTPDESGIAPSLSHPYLSLDLTKFHSGKSGYFGANEPWYFIPGKTGFEAVNFWPEDVPNYGKLDSTPYYWTGVYRSVATGKKIDNYEFKSFTFAGYYPDAFHTYNFIKGQFEKDYSPGGNSVGSLSENSPLDFPNSKTLFQIEADYITKVYETCHGQPLPWGHGKTGKWNYYHAFYAPGYIQPPYGETPSTTVIGGCGPVAGYGLGDLDSLLPEALDAGGCCKKITNSEKYQLWGIRTVYPKQGFLSSTDTDRGAPGPLYSPAVECPPEFPPDVYYQQEGFSYHPGSIMARGAGNLYNDSPFPGSIDTDGWEVDNIYTTQICENPNPGNNSRWLGFKLKNGFPELSYPISGTNERKLDSPLCQGRLLETSTAVGNFQSIQLGAGAGNATAFNDQANFQGFDPFVDWHFVFRYNMDEYPNDTHNTTSQKVAGLCGGVNESELLEHFWTYRQCPNTVDFLPWTTSSTIYACPRDYFDIPYYASIGKFGYYGARFLNRCAKPEAFLDDETRIYPSFHYFSLSVCGQQNPTSDELLSVKCLSSQCLPVPEQVLKIDYACYNAKFVRTSNVDEPTHFVISRNAENFGTGELACYTCEHLRSDSEYKNIKSFDGSYTTVDISGDVRDYPRLVQDCEVYQAPETIAGTCSENDYSSLLSIATQEQRLGDFFVGNIGFFLWVNYDIITNTRTWTELFTDPLCISKNPDGSCFAYDKELLGAAEIKSALQGLKLSFDTSLSSLPNFLRGLDDPLILFENLSSEQLFVGGTTSLSDKYSSSDILFTNERYLAMMREIEENPLNIFVNGEKYKIAWNDIIDNYGHFVASGPCKEASNGLCLKLPDINSSFYANLAESKQKRLLTRYMENHLRAKPIDLFPLNHIFFSYDEAADYENNKNWGKSIYKKGSSSLSIDDSIPEVNRRYFEGTYGTSGSYSSIVEPLIRKQLTTLDYYAGNFRNFYCGSDVPTPHYENAAGTALQTFNGAIPASPWKIKGANDVGNIRSLFSCMTPIFVQEPIDVTCKIGQPPTFRCQAVDYHTIPEDKISKGYPEIDFWVNSLKLSNPRGKNIYPITYQWYRIPRKFLKRNSKTFLRHDVADDIRKNKAPDGELEIGVSVIDFAEPASLTGYWSCLEGISGKGDTECTLFHPRFSMPVDIMCTSLYCQKDEDTDKIIYSGKYYESTPNFDYHDKKSGEARVKKFFPQKNWPDYDHLSGFSSDGYIYPHLMTNIKGASIVGKSQRLITTGELAALSGDLSKLRNIIKGYVNPLYAGETEAFGDDDYLYFCVASGRFGFRKSEMVSLDIEQWIKLDVSIRNGSPVGFQSPSISLSPENAFGETVEILLSQGFGANNHPNAGYQQSGQPVKGFFGIQKDTNQVWENLVKEHINMANNCVSYAFIGTEGFRGCLRTYRPPTQHGIRGTDMERAGYFDYGLLVPFGTILTQEQGDALYGKSPYKIETSDKKIRPYQMGGGHHLPKCQHGIMPFGAVGVPMSINLEVGLGINQKGGQSDSCHEGIANLKNFDPSVRESPPFHWSVDEPAAICETKMGISPSKMSHFGELYPYGENDIMYNYWPLTSLSTNHGIGVTWQFSNNLGTIKRFGYRTPLPSSRDFVTRQVSPASQAFGAFETYTISEFMDNLDVVWWPSMHSSLISQKKEFEAAKRMIGGTGLGGVDCGWNRSSGGRFMLYFVENLMMFYLGCNASGKKMSRVTNQSYIGPGLRWGTSAIQYFWGGMPYNGFLRRNPLYGPYAFEWKTMPHNRDRNGNGISEGFYSMKHKRNMYLYDPPAIFGLYARQKTKQERPEITHIRKLRKEAWAIPKERLYEITNEKIQGVRFGRYGMTSGCGTIRMSCTPDRRTSDYQGSDTIQGQFLWKGPYVGKDWDARECRWLTRALELGPDPGWFYGCNEEQLVAGLCFDPCLSMKYTHGFFPGGKLLALNNYVKYSKIRNEYKSAFNKENIETEEDKAVTIVNNGDHTSSTVKYITQLSHNSDDEEIEINIHRPVKLVEYTIFDIKDPNNLTELEEERFRHIQEHGFLKIEEAKPELRRIMRGPWATPYRQIKAFEHGKSISKQKVQEKADGESKETTKEFSVTNGPPAFDNSHYQSYSQNKKDVYKVRTNTSISPCNSRGADHCSYMTMTLHINMDTRFHVLGNAFDYVSSHLAGSYVDSPELTKLAQKAIQEAAVQALKAAAGIAVDLILASLGVSTAVGLIMSLGKLKTLEVGGTIIIDAVSTLIEPTEKQKIDFFHDFLSNCSFGDEFKVHAEKMAKGLAALKRNNPAAAEAMSPEDLEEATLVVFKLSLAEGSALD